MLTNSIDFRLFLLQNYIEVINNFKKRKLKKKLQIPNFKTKIIIK